MKITNSILAALALQFAAPAAPASPFMEFQGPAKVIPKSLLNSNRVPVSLVKIRPPAFATAQTIGIGGNNELEIRLTPELRWKVALSGFQSSGKDSWAASGALVGNSSGYASIGYSNGTYVLNVVDLSRQESYGVFPIEGGAYLSYRQLPDDKPFCDHKGNRTAPAFSHPSLLRKSAASQADDSLLVDMAFYWTSDAAEALGGDDAVKAHINRNVLDLNEALKRSDGKGQWRVGLAQKIDHSGIEGAPNILEYAGRSSASVFDSLVAESCLRGLDYTQIILANGFPPDIVGMNHASLTFVQASAMGYVTTVHEAGHALGCSHERAYYPDRGASRSEFAFGFDGLDSSGALMRCIMYHRDGTYRIPYFSNPNLTVRGTKIGIPIGSVDSLGRNNSADCAEQIRRNGAAELGTNSSTGLTIGGFKKYAAVSPGGVQEYWLKIGNISGQELTVFDVGIHKDATDSLISSDPPGTLQGNTYFMWQNLGKVPPGEFLKPTLSERTIRFTLKAGLGKNQIGPVSYYVQNLRSLNQETISATPVDPNAGIAPGNNADNARLSGFRTGISGSRFLDPALSPNRVVIYNLLGSSRTVAPGTSNREEVFPAFGWKAIKEEDN